MSKLQNRNWLGVQNFGYPCFLGVLILMFVGCFSESHALSLLRQFNSTQIAQLNKVQQLHQEALILRQQQNRASLEQALEKLDLAVKLAHETSDTEAESLCLEAAGAISADLQFYRRSIAYYKQALSLTKDTETKAVVYHGLGTVYHEINELETARDLYQQSLPLFRELRISKQEGRVLDSLGDIHKRLGDIRTARQFFEEALVKRAGDTPGEAVTLNSLGHLLVDVGDVPQGLKCLEQSLEKRIAAGDRRGEARMRMNIGDIYDELGEREKALEFLNKSVAMWEDLKDWRGLAASYRIRGKIYTGRGNLTNAMADFERALDLSQQNRDPYGKFITLNNIGELHSMLGDLDESLKNFRNARQLIPPNDHKSLADNLSGFGGVYSAFGDAEKALNSYEQALKLRRDSKEPRKIAESLNSVASMQFALGKKEEARDLWEEALGIYEALGSREGESIVLNNLAGYYTLIDGGENKTKEYGLRCLLLLRSIGNKSLEAELLTNFAKAYQVVDPEYSIFLAKLAVNAGQQQRLSIKTFDVPLQKSFLRTIRYRYSLLTEKLLEHKREREALQVLLTARDQEFYDYASSGSALPPQLHKVDLTIRETLAEQRFQQALSAIEAVAHQHQELKIQLYTRNPSPAEEQTLQRLEADLKQKQDQFRMLFYQLAAEFQQPATGESKEETTTKELQQTLRELSQRTGKKAAAIYTVPGIEKYYSLLITPDSITPSTATMIKPAHLNEKALRFLHLLQTPAFDPSNAAKELYDIILKPLEAELQKSRIETLMWSPDGALSYVPMAALYDGKQYLVSRFQHAVFTRANRERMMAAVSPQWRGIGFGATNAQTIKIGSEPFSFGRLSGVREEGTMIFGDSGQHRKGLLPGEMRYDEQFNKTSFLAGLKQGANAVHIASHFLFRPGDDRSSFLLLGDGSTMTLAEMKAIPDLFKGVEMLTLSACNTAAQESDKMGREIDGFAELAQRLGAKAIIASLWEVADNSTAQLMAEYYRQRGTGKLTKAEAIQRAQLKLLEGEIRPPASSSRPNDTLALGTRAAEIPGLRKEALFKSDPQKPYAHPYYWAPFILIGNWQ